ncbi:MAG: hypothetical protein HY841_01190 [Bacteroidetes bacterium]|nr:hypothetical protein [Bacteroidota bacterium]
MSSTSETGHAKNVANFEDLISFATGYGTTYNPSKASIKIPALNTLLTNSQGALSTLKTKKTTFDNSTNAREIAFESFKKYCTRIINALEATDASKQTVDDAKTINRKLQGKRADKIVTPTPPADPNVKVEEIHHISVSQQSFDNYIDNFDKLLKLVTAEPLYIPNETDLKITGMNTTITNLKAVNTSVINATTPYSNSIIARDSTLYADGTGLVDIALEVKKYVKSVFGATSPQYKQVSKLQFKSRRKK